MTSFRSHLEAVEAADALLRIDEQVHWAVETSTVANEAVRNNGPAVLFTETTGISQLVSGLYTGPDLMQRRKHKPWSRIALGVGLEETNHNSYADLLNIVASSKTTQTELSYESIVATRQSNDLYALGLPKRTVDGRPTLTLGLLVTTIDDTTVWTPVRGTVRGTHQFRIAVPEPVANRLEDGADVTIALGVPAAALLATSLQWAGESGIKDSVTRTNAIDSVPVGEADGGLVPATAEVLLDGVVSRASSLPEGPREAWELMTVTSALDITIKQTMTRENPIIPFAPLGAPMADDVTLVGLVESARLFHRTNNYWGVSPVKWILLPPETNLGFCLIASEILYAGFDWQLANTLFSFSRLFDKVVILDDDVPPADLARAFDDIWVKAHPADDWIFSEPNAPATSTPSYQREEEIGSRLYINAAWNESWEEEYIAPRINFTNSYPEDVQRSVIENWEEYGFNYSPR